MAKYLKDIAYETLRDKIINCEYEPGTVLTESALRDVLGASRTPIRDAIAKLSTENLVTIIPKKGIIINGIQLTDVIQIYDARINLEPQLIRHYGHNLDKDVLRAFLSICETSDNVQEIIKSDDSFHSLIYDSCTNKYLREVLKTLEGHNHRNRVWKSDFRRVVESKKEHQAILEALLKDDYENAAALMEVHLTNAKNFAIRKY